jgi:hypothetical protein
LSEEPYRRALSFSVSHLHEMVAILASTGMARRIRCACQTAGAGYLHVQQT